MSKSDIKAKEAYIKFLLSQGFDEAHVTARPADITAHKNGETYYFEIKKTSKENRYSHNLSAGLLSLYFFFRNLLILLQNQICSFGVL